MEDSVIDSFDGCSVIFRDVKEYFSAGHVINCRFSVKDNCDIDNPADCYIGLFHVGWNTLCSCITKKSFTLVEHLTNGLYNLDFQNNETPESNYDEFYQFCFYNIKTEVVFGASCPFQICDLKQLDSLAQINQGPLIGSEWWIHGAPVDEDIDDTVLIHNKTTMLEDSLAKKVEENEVLKTMKQKFEMEITKFNMDKKDYIKKAEAELADLKDQLCFQHEREAILDQSLADSEKIINHLTGKIKEVKEIGVIEYTDKLKSYEELIEKISHDYKVVTSEKEILINKLHESIHLYEKEMMKSQNCKEKIEALSFECEGLEKSLVHEKRLNVTLESDYQDMVSSFTKKIEALSEENVDSQDLLVKLSDTENKLSAEKKRNSSLLLEVENLVTSLENMEVGHKTKELANLTDRSKLSEDLQKKDDAIIQLTREKEEVIEKLRQEEMKRLKMIEEDGDVVSDLESKLLESKKECADVKIELANQAEAFTCDILKKDVIISNLEENVCQLDSEVYEIHTILKCSQRNSCRTIEKMEMNMAELRVNIEQLNSEKKLEHGAGNKSLDSGSHHALQVANAHMQKQVKYLKKEKECYQKLYNQQHSGDSGIKEMEKLNEEMKLRLLMGKREYKEKYLECQRLQTELAKLQNSIQTSDTSCASDDNNKTDYVDAAILVQEKEKHEQELQRLMEEKDNIVKQHSEIQKEMEECKQNEMELSNDVEEMKLKTKRLAEHYEGKIKLLEEENKMLKKQRDAILTGDANMGKSTIDNIVELQPINTNDTIIFHPPSSGIKKEIVIQQQPDVLDKIMYPPSFNVIGDRDEKAWFPAVVRTTPKMKPPKQQAVSEPPSNQVMPSRETEKPLYSTLSGRGKHSFYDQLTFRCPVCDMKFPPGFSDVSATQHVNNHFNEEH